MKINFLGASDGTPLTKTFKEDERAPGKYDVAPYPMWVTEFDSEERQAESLQDLHEHIQEFAGKGFCLLKGELDRPLKKESRAGRTNPYEPTSWMCLDVDTTVRNQTPAEWLDELGPEFKGVSFIFQYSVSMGIKADLKDGWRGHFFLMLDAPPLPPPLLKQWLQQKNLQHATLQTAIELTAGGGSLKYPLDITTCQNDKLLYIAPPICVGEGFEDPIKERFILVERDHALLSLDMTMLNSKVQQRAYQQKLLSLRKAQGLPDKEFHFSSMGSDAEILENPDPMKVTGIKDREGHDFVYLNLNGGDSWGYWFFRNNPHILHNFKGEPNYRMKDVDPELLIKYAGEDGTVKEPFVFRDLVTDNYYNAIRDPIRKEILEIYRAGSTQKLKHFLVNNGCPPPPKWTVEDWRIVFDPTNDLQIDDTNRTVNTFRRTEYMVNAIFGGRIGPLINKVLDSICVDEQTKTHFLNWLAYIFQTRKKTGTAWIFQGTQGTGKGVLFHKVLRPLLGLPFTHEITMERMADDFVDFMDENILLVIDEANAGDNRESRRIMNRLKSFITEPEINARIMHKGHSMHTNFSNIILYSNSHLIVPLETGDRRFNVAPRQEKQLQMTHREVNVEIEKELSDFANFLHSYEVDVEAVNTVIDSEARQHMIQLAKTTPQVFFEAFLTGDLEYFLACIDLNSEAVSLGSHVIPRQECAHILKRWIGCTQRNETCRVTNTEMMTLYNYVQNERTQPGGFGKTAAKYGVRFVNQKVDGKQRKSISINWNLDDPDAYSEKETNVVPMRKKNDN